MISDLSFRCQRFSLTPSGKGNSVSLKADTWRVEKVSAFKLTPGYLTEVDGVRLKH